MRNTLIALIAVSPLAFAQQASMPNMPDLGALFFKQFDSNQDGVVSKAEFLEPTNAQFDHMDKDNNGSLDAAEVEAFNAEMMKRMQEMQRQMPQQGRPQR